jgi:hypothetical protein
MQVGYNKDWTAGTELLGRKTVAEQPRYVLSRTSYPDCLVLAFLFWLSYHSCPIPVLSMLLLAILSSFLVLAVLSWPSSRVVLSRLSVLAVVSRFSFSLSCSCCHVLTILCPICPVPAALSKIGPFLIILSRPFCSCCPVLAVLGCPDNAVLSVVY